MSNKILVPTDFSEHSLSALHFAAKIANAVKGEIVLLHVMETYEYNVQLEENLGEGYLSAIQKAAEDKLRNYKFENSDLLGIPMTTMFRKGKIHKEISKIAKDMSAKMIIMGTHGATASGDIERRILGSNAYRTVSSSPCPVVTLREASTKVEIKNILLPLDITQTTTQKVDTAINWAREFGATIHIISVAEFMDEFNVNYDKMVNQLNEVAEKIEQAGISTQSGMMRNVDVAKGVMEYAENEENKIDLVIIMTRQENLFNELILGSHARKIIAQSKVPVLSLRPQEQ